MGVGVKRPVGYASLLAATGLFVATNVLRSTWTASRALTTVEVWTLKALLAGAVALAAYGGYLLASRVVARWSADRRRQHDLRNLLRLAFGLAGAVGVAGALTEQWVGVLFSLGVVGFAVTFALQQPMFSLLGWVYVMTMRPFQVGDRVRIDEARGDVVEIDFLVTTLWEVHGDLVESHQPSGRRVTVPNSVVLQEEVYNYTNEEFPYVWTETTVQVSYETDLAFARDLAREVADDYCGDEMAARIAEYRDHLEETPVDLDVNDRPTVNVEQAESWVELHVRVLVDPRNIQAAENDLYAAILTAFKDHPDRISYPVGRFR